MLRRDPPTCPRLPGLLSFGWEERVPACDGYHTSPRARWPDAPATAGARGGTKPIIVTTTEALLPALAAETACLGPFPTRLLPQHPPFPLPLPSAAGLPPRADEFRAAPRPGPPPNPPPPPPPPPPLARWASARAACTRGGRWAWRVSSPRNGSCGATTTPSRRTSTSNTCTRPCPPSRRSSENERGRREARGPPGAPPAPSYAGPPVRVYRDPPRPLLSSAPRRSPPRAAPPAPPLPRAPRPPPPPAAAAALGARGRRGQASAGASGGGSGRGSHPPSPPDPPSRTSCRR